MLWCLLVPLHSLFSQQSHDWLRSPLWGKLTATLLPRVRTLLSPGTLANLVSHHIGWNYFPNIVRNQSLWPRRGKGRLAPAIGWVPGFVAGGIHFTENIWLRSRNCVSLGAKSGNYWWVKWETPSKWAFIRCPIHLDMNLPSGDIVHLSWVLGIIYLLSKELESH